jgi:DNA-directed RNA polymerase specialized sigma24 family protein
MDSNGSVEILLEAMHQGHISALGKLHQRYWPSLVAYARGRLRLASAAGVDEEDIVQAAFLSFHRAFCEGRIPRLTSRENLLAVLTTIIARKSARKAAGPELTSGHGLLFLEQLALASGVSPLEQAILNDCYERYVGGLPVKLRPFAEMCLAGMTHREIAASMPCAVRTVERKINRIADHWREISASIAE